MKKNLFDIRRGYEKVILNLFSVIIFTALTLFGVFNNFYVYAQSNFSDIEQLLNAGDRGYGASDVVTVKNTSNDSITLTSPVIRKDGTVISGYKVVYSEKPLASAPSNSISTKNFSFNNISTSTIDFVIDNLKPGTKYYFAIEPVNLQGVSGIPSDQITATTTTDSSMSSAPVNNNVLNSAGPASNCEINNISYTISDSIVNLTWTPTTSDVSVDIFLRFGNEKNSKKLGTVNGSAGTYSFTVSKIGTYFATFIPQAGSVTCREKVQTIKVGSIKTTIDDDIPKNGPSLNIVIIAIVICVFVYFLYRLSFVHSDSHFNKKNKHHKK